MENSMTPRLIYISGPAVLLLAAGIAWLLGA